MSNTTISWNNNTPADTDLVGQGDDIIRSLKSNLQGALDAEHLFPSAGGAAGAHRRGSARVFVGTSSEVSSADTDGRLMFNSSTSQFIYLNSTSSTIVGGRTVPHAPTTSFGGSGLSLTRFAAIDAGFVSNLTPGGAGLGATFGRSFATAPTVTLTLGQVDTTGTKVYAPHVTSVTTAGFSFAWAGVEGASVSTATFYWMAAGVANYP